MCALWVRSRRIPSQYIIFTIVVDLHCLALAVVVLAMAVADDDDDGVGCCYNFYFLLPSNQIGPLLSTIIIFAVHLTGVQHFR